MLEKMGDFLRKIWQFFASTVLARTIVVSAIVIFIASVVFAVYMSQTKQVTSKPGTKSYQQSRLTLQPEKLIVLPADLNTKQTVAVKINANDNKVTGVQMELGYNQEVLTDVDITPGNFIENPIVLSKVVNKEKGRITYILTSSPNGDGKSGKGVVAYLTFKASHPNNNKKSTIRFRKNTIVTAIGYKDNVLKHTDSMTVVFKQ